MRRSLLALLLSLAMLVSLLSGCGGKTESASAPADSAPAETAAAADSAPAPSEAPAPAPTASIEEPEVASVEDEAPVEYATMAE